MQDTDHEHIGVRAGAHMVGTDPQMVEYYSGPCANEIYAPYVYVGHCYGYGDEAVLHHRIGVASAPEWIGQPGIFLVLTCL